VNYTAEQKFAANRVALLRSAAQANWRFVNDVQLYCPASQSGLSSTRRPWVNDLLPELTRLPCLTAVNFHGVCVSAVAFQQFCIAVAPRLQVLLIDTALADNAVDPRWHIGLLRELRVLVIDEFPPMAALLHLHQLEYLHVAQPPDYTTSLYSTALRHLSSSHALRSLSFGTRCESATAPLVYGLLSTAPPGGLNAAHAALVDWSQPAQLTDLSFAHSIDDELLQQCAAIPTLTRLQASTDNSRWELTPQPSLSVFAHLQQLRLKFHDAALLPHLAECHKLRVLQLSFRNAGYINAGSLSAIVASNAATLEELRFCATTDSVPLGLKDGAAGAEKWSTLPV
jgi:hypothetical protein